MYVRGDQACPVRNFVCRGSNFVCPGMKHARGAILHGGVWPSRISSHFWPDKDEALLVGLHRSQKSSKKQISSWEASKMKNSWSGSPQPAEKAILYVQGFVPLGRPKIQRKSKYKKVRPSSQKPMHITNGKIQQQKLQKTQKKCTAFPPFKS